MALLLSPDKNVKPTALERLDGANLYPQAFSVYLNKTIREQVSCMCVSLLPRAETHHAELLPCLAISNLPQIKSEWNRPAFLCTRKFSGRRKIIRLYHVQSKTCRI
jgi:hypothetical protein